MGLHASIYTNRLYGSCSNRGISERAQEVCIVNAEGPFKADENRPGVKLVRHAGHVIAVPVDVPDSSKMVGPMAGGAYIASSDSRFSQAVESLLGRPFYGAVPLHDRFDTWADYEMLSR